MASTTVFDDFDAEAAVFRGLVSGLAIEEWTTATPAPGWSVQDQVAHVAFVFNLAATAASAPDTFRSIIASVPPGGFGAAVQAGVERYRAGCGEDAVRRWEAEVQAASSGLRALGPDAVVPWLVNQLPVPVLLRAGMMELFAHGQDVADARSVPVERTDRVAHLVGFVHHTRAFGYEARGIAAPDVSLRFDLTLPSGRPFCVGPADAENTVSGPAVDLCLVASRRRHRADVDLVASGPEAERWLTVAQAYRGDPGQGRRPGQFAAPAVRATAAS